MARRLGSMFGLMALVQALAMSAAGQDGGPAIGRRVLLPVGVKLDDSDPDSVRVYRVERVNEEWLHLSAKGKEAASWVKASDVVPYEQAVDFLTDQIRANPQAYLYKLRGDVRSEKQEFELAIGDFTEAIRLDPKFAAAFRGRADVWSEKNNDDKAIADYTKAIDFDKNDALTFFKRGTVSYRNEKKIIRERVNLKQIDIGLSPQYQSRKPAQDRNVGEKDFEKAIARCSESVRLNPESALAYLNRGIALSSGEVLFRFHHEHLNDAIVDFTKAIGLDPGYVLAYYKRGCVWRSKWELVEAIADYTKAIDLDPGFVLALIDRGDIWSLRSNPLGDYDKAIADYTRAIRLDPKSARAYRGLCIAWYRKKDRERAIAALREANRLDPPDPLFLDSPYSSFTESGDYAFAIKDFSEAIRLDPSLVAAFCGRGLALSKNHEDFQAKEDFDKAIDLDPKCAAGYSGRAWLLATDGKYSGQGEEAVHDATQANELTGWKDGTHLRILAAAHAAMRNYAKAIEWQEKANALSTDAEGRAMGETLLKRYRDNTSFKTFY